MTEDLFMAAERMEFGSNKIRTVNGWIGTLFDGLIVSL